MMMSKAYFECELDENERKAGRKEAAGTLRVTTINLALISFPYESVLHLLLIPFYNAIKSLNFSFPSLSLSQSSHHPSTVVASVETLKLIFFSRNTH
jgi:hypothetical protein